MAFQTLKRENTLTSRSSPSTIVPAEHVRTTRKQLVSIGDTILGMNISLKRVFFERTAAVANFALTLPLYEKNKSSVCCFCLGLRV